MRCKRGQLYIYKASRPSIHSRFRLAVMQSLALRLAAIKLNLIGLFVNPQPQESKLAEIDVGHLVGLERRLALLRGLRFFSSRPIWR